MFNLGLTYLILLNSEGRVTFWVTFCRLMVFLQMCCDIIFNETQELYASHIVHGRVLCPTKVLHFCASSYLFIYEQKDYFFSFLSYTYTLTLEQRLRPSVELNFDTIHIHSYLLCAYVIKRMLIPVFITNISVFYYY